MNGRSAQVRTSLALRLVIPEENPTPLRASLEYRAKDPYAVHMTFHGGDAEADISWSFARELLTDGLYRQSGLGDVTVWPWAGRSEHTLGMALSSPDGYALFELSRSAVEQFLSRSYTIVPAGTEADFMDLDAVLALLRAAPGADAH